jgi:hypothetical protein
MTGSKAGIYWAGPTKSDGRNAYNINEKAKPNTITGMANFLT